MITIRYDWRYADEAGYRKMRPVEVLRSLGLQTGRSEHVPIGDCTFVEIDRLPDPLPKFIEVSPKFEFTE